MPNLKVALSIPAAIMIMCCATPMAPPVKMPSYDPDQRERVEFRLVTSPISDASENSVSSPVARILRGSSVVIDVPRLRVASEASEATNADEFSTSGYFNVAERAMEKQLLVGGFVVKDRAKFEAILRDLRDDGLADDSVLGPAYQDLRSQLEKEEITQDEFADRVRELRSKLQIERAGQGHLIDTSEVIRAASATEVRADFILQISKFSPLERRSESVNLLSNASLRDFADQYRAVETKFTNESFGYYNCDFAQASLDAKLIEVATGNVVWIGSHKVTEIDQEDNNAGVVFEVTYERTCSNCAQLRRRVAQLNTESERERRFGQDPPKLTPSYQETVSSARKIGGSQCEFTARTKEELDGVRRQLASRVADELIQTIRLHDG